MGSPFPEITPEQWQALVEERRQFAAELFDLLLREDADAGQVALFVIESHLLVAQAIHRGIVTRLGADENVRVENRGQVAQDLRQLSRAELARSTRAVAKTGEANDLVARHRGPGCRQMSARELSQIVLRPPADLPSRRSAPADPRPVTCRRDLAGESGISAKRHARLV